MKAVIVVDMLHEFVEGRLGSDDARAIVPAVQRAIDAARRRGWPVAYANDAHRPGDPEIAVWGEHAMFDDYGARLCGGLSADCGWNEDVFAKRAYSAFSNQDLERWLIGRDVDEIVLVGTAAGICVAQTAIDGFQLGLKVALVEDAIAGLPGDDVPFWLRHIQRLTGATVVRADDLADAA